MQGLVLEDESSGVGESESVFSFWKSESVFSLEKKQFRSHSLAPSLWHQAGLEDVSLLLSFYRGRVASIKTRS